MPVWLTILLAIISGLGTIFGCVGISAYFSTRGQHKAHKKNQAEDEEEAKIEKLKKQEYENWLRNIIREESKPIQDRIDTLEEILKSLLESNVLQLRCNIQAIRERGLQNKFLDFGDKMTAKELRDKYESLGGNNFREYVNRWMKEIADFPEEPVKKSSSSTKKKKILVENKK